jgi:hypothetical protein
MNQNKPVFVVPTGAKVLQPFEMAHLDANTIIQKLALAEQTMEPSFIAVDDRDLQFIVETLDRIDCWPILLFGVKGAEYSRIWNMNRARNESVNIDGLEKWLIAYEDRFGETGGMTFPVENTIHSPMKTGLQPRPMARRTAEATDEAFNSTSIE